MHYLSELAVLARAMMRALLHIAVGMWVFVSTVGAPVIHHFCAVPVPVAECGCPVDEENPCCEVEVEFATFDLPAVAPDLWRELAPAAEAVLPLPLVTMIENAFAQVEHTYGERHSSQFFPFFEDHLQTTRLLI